MQVLTNEKYRGIFVLAVIDVNLPSSAVEQAPTSEIAKEYNAIAEMIISGKMEREELRHE